MGKSFTSQTRLPDSAHFQDSSLSEQKQQQQLQQKKKREREKERKKERKKERRKKERKKEKEMEKKRAIYSREHNLYITTD